MSARADLTPARAAPSTPDGRRPARRERPDGPDLICALTVAERRLSNDVTHAVQTTEHELAELRRTGSPHGVCAAMSSQALLYAAAIRAVEVASAGIEQLRRHGPYNALPFGIGHAALLYALTGDVPRAEVDDAAIDARSAAIVANPETRAGDCTRLPRNAEIAQSSGHRMVASRGRRSDTLQPYRIPAPVTARLASRTPQNADS